MDYKEKMEHKGFYQKEEIGMKWKRSCKEELDFGENEKKRKENGNQK